MNIYLVERTDKPGWDETLGFVIAATDEYQAREVASSSTNGDEGRDLWTDSTRSKCERVGYAEESRDAFIILKSFRAG